MSLERREGPIPPWKHGQSSRIVVGLKAEHIERAFARISQDQWGLDGIRIGPENTEKTSNIPLRVEANYIEQSKEHQLRDVVDYELFKGIESARRMEESRMGPHGSSWPQTPASAFREPVYRDYDMFTTPRMFFSQPFVS